jgi:hypothetical protein
MVLVFILMWRFPFDELRTGPKRTLEKQPGVILEIARYWQKISYSLFRVSSEQILEYK